MVSTTTQVKARSVTGEEVHLLANHTDSPLVNVQDLERLNSFRPDLIDWVVEQTNEEAQFRRQETRRLNSFVFWEHIGGLLLSVIICLTGIIGSIIALRFGGEHLAIVIAIATIATLAVSYLRR